MSDVTKYREFLKEARADFDTSMSRLRVVQAEERELSRRISRLRRTITALAAQCSEAPGIDDLGITDSVHEVMESTTYKMSTADVVSALENMGFDLASQKNAAASVHAILTRLAEKEKIQKVSGYDGKNVMWTGPKHDPKTYEITDDDIPF
jgi:CHASE3 domain sensor protein